MKINEPTHDNSLFYADLNDIKQQIEQCETIVATANKLFTWTKYFYKVASIDYKTTGGAYKHKVISIIGNEAQATPDEMTTEILTNTRDCIGEPDVATIGCIAEISKDLDIKYIYYNPTY